MTFKSFSGCDRFLTTNSKAFSRAPRRDAPRPTPKKNKEEVAAVLLQGFRDGCFSQVFIQGGSKVLAVALYQ